ncbi:MAG: Hsp70 family protein, partial [Pirellulaceae bacterium]
ADDVDRSKPMDESARTAFGFGSSHSTGFDDLDFETSIPPDPEIPEEMGEYRIRKLIGSGGMGRVFLAEHGRMERLVALKTLTAARMGDAASIERFYSEVRAAGRLLHPNIVTAFDAGEIAGIHYLAMEYVDGPTLTAMVSERGPLPMSDAVDVLRQAAIGLLHAHQAGIIHRDIKPGNLMRAPNGTIKVLDLGLARVGADPRGRSKKGRLVGTVEFIAPEQLEHADRADARSDIYSLGATFYFLLTGQTPYAGELLDQIRGQREGPIPDLFSLRQDVDIRLDHVLRRMMAKQPQQRYRNLSELIEDLDCWSAAHQTVGWSEGTALPTGVRETPTVGGATTTSSVTEVMGVDLGMFYASAAFADPAGHVQTLEAGGPGKPLLRLALASRHGTLQYGADALAYREKHPERVAHCLPLYIGQAVVGRRVAGKQCPPEVLIGLLLRRVRDLAWNRRGVPRAAAITVPSCYDQFHRRSVLQAAEVAGFRSLRLIDRSLAAAQVTLLDEPPEMRRDESPAAEHQLIFSIAGNVTEAVVVRRTGGRIQQLATAGDWHSGTLNWQHRLVDLVAERCMAQFHIDPRISLTDAAPLQLACERAMNQLLLHHEARISFRAGKQDRSLSISRDALFASARDRMHELTKLIRNAIEAAQIDASQIRRCVTIGLMTRMPVLRKLLLDELAPDVELIALDRSDLARGAAAAVAAELPGRSGIPLPPQASTSHDLGILIQSKGPQKRQILPIIPRGTILPARTNRRLTIGLDNTEQTLTMVESSGWESPSWCSLGNYRLPAQTTPCALEVTFEVDMNGLLSVRTRDPESGKIERLDPLPTPTLTQSDLVEWGGWIDELAEQSTGPRKTD